CRRRLDRRFGRRRSVRRLIDPRATDDVGCDRRRRGSGGRRQPVEPAIERAQRALGLFELIAQCAGAAEQRERRALIHKKQNKQHEKEQPPTLALWFRRRLAFWRSPETRRRRRGPGERG